MFYKAVFGALLLQFLTKELFLIHSSLLTCCWQVVPFSNSCSALVPLFHSSFLHSSLLLTVRFTRQLLSSRVWVQTCPVCHSMARKVHPSCSCGPGCDGMEWRGQCPGMVVLPQALASSPATLSGGTHGVGGGQGAQGLPNSSLSPWLQRGMSCLWAASELGVCREQQEPRGAGPSPVQLLPAFASASWSSA